MTDRLRNNFLGSSLNDFECPINYESFGKNFNGLPSTLEAQEDYLMLGFILSPSK